LSEWQPEQNPEEKQKNDRMGDPEESGKDVEPEDDGEHAHDISRGRQTECFSGFHVYPSCQRRAARIVTCARRIAGPFFSYQGKRQNGCNT
jgi:hypothetical protein